MLRYGFFKDFKGSDSLLIWGDAVALAELQSNLARLATGAAIRITLEAIEVARGMPGVSVAFEVGQEELIVSYSVDATTIIGRCSTERFAEFVAKLAGLVDQKCQSGHQYLDWPNLANVQVIVSKGEYPHDVGSTLSSGEHR